MHRIMGLDIGDKRIGIAFSDLLGYTAQGHSVYQRRDNEHDISFLANLAREQDAACIVFGLPKNMNGTEGPQAEKVRAFAEAISQAAPDIKTAFWDERLTTVAAHKIMLEGDLSRAKRGKKVDQLAAVLILQGYLDHQQYRLNQ